MIEKKVLAFVAKHAFDLTGKSFAVGVSGGPDSLALLHFLWRLQDKLNIEITAVHVDHMFRGAESYDEALFVRKFCEERSIDFEMIQADVPAHIEKKGKNPQLAARELRYQFFADVMNKKKLKYLALGHHGDDQIETILMRLTRGSSEKARAGIPFLRPFRAGFIIRPFLCLAKSDLEEYCQHYDLEPRRDPSNEKEVYSRNRFRKNILPFLKKENPLVHQHFQRFSEDLEMDEKYLFELTSEKMNKVMKKTEQKITLDIQAFLAMPMPLQRRGIKLILSYLYKEHTDSLSAVHIENVYSMIRSPHPSGSLDFPNGLKVVRSYGDCHFEIFPKESKPFYFEIHGPAQVQMPDGERIEADYVFDYNEFVQNERSFILNIKDIRMPLIVRNRRAGDRMTLKGMTGSRKLKDIFIDAKIPISKRDSWPVITDQDGKILWLPGLKKSNYSIDRTESGNLLTLKFMQ